MTDDEQAEAVVDGLAKDYDEFRCKCGMFLRARRPGIMSMVRPKMDLPLQRRQREMVSRMTDDEQARAVIDGLSGVSAIRRGRNNRKDRAVWYIYDGCNGAFYSAEGIFLSYGPGDRPILEHRSGHSYTKWNETGTPTWFAGHPPA